MKNKLYIDCQFFQTEAWDRGMGRYTLSLLGSIYAKNDIFECVLIFSTNLPNNKAAITALSKICPDAKIVNLNLLSTQDNKIKKAIVHNEHLLNEYIEKDNKGSRSNNLTYLIPCLFQEPTVSVFPENVKKSLIYYDAIPLLYYERYRNAIAYDAYLDRYKMLFDADIIFTISQTIADDLLIYLGVANSDTKKVVNIDGACNTEMFANIVKPDISISGEYILLPSSSDIRKNNHIAVKAFEQLRNLSQENYTLVITSTFNKEQRDQLTNSVSNVIFTGNIAEEELAWLYVNAKAVLFTSEYEGLGLPILEAVRAGSKIACSNIPVFREISENAFYLFDPLDVQEVTLALYDAIQGKDWISKQKNYPLIEKKYKWDRSASIVLTELSKSHKNNKKSTVQKKEKLKLAILAPSPNGYSAIGKVVQELHAVTSQRFEVDYYLENSKNKEASQINVRPNYLQAIAPCYPVEIFNAKAYQNYDIVLYHIGNSEYHFNTIINALYLPGIAIFHDTVLEEVFGEMVRLGYMSHERFDAEKKLDDLFSVNGINSKYITSVTTNQLALLAHSNYATNALKGATNNTIKVIHAELPVALPERSVLSQKRKKVHIGLAGILTGNKGLDIIKALALDKTIESDVVIHVFGFNFIEPTIVDELEAYKNVHLMTNLSDLEYQTQISNLDILVNYRTSYRGETSLTVLEAMRYGCTVIVNGTLGWFGELPDEVVLKVEDKSDIINAVRRLVLSKEARDVIGSAAREFIKITHSPESYVDTIYQMASRKNQNFEYVKSDILKKSDNLREVLSRLKDKEGA